MSAIEDGCSLNLRIRKEKMEKRLLIDNTSCILVEFSNEDEALAIGYTCWLTETVTEEELNNITESKKEVEVVWPKCDVQSARKMKAIFKGLTEEHWEVHAVKVLGFGDWINMSAELESLKKNNVLSTTKQNRHLIMKKSFDDTEYASSTSKTDKSIKKSYKNEKQLLRKVEAQKRNATILKKILKTNKTTKIDELENITSESESTTSEEEHAIKKSRSQLQTDLTILTMENKKLREEVVHYRNISFARNEAEKLLVDLQSSRTVLSEIHFVCSVCYNAQGSYLSTNKVSPLKSKKLNGNFKNYLQDKQESNELKKYDPESSPISQKYVRFEVSKEIKPDNEEPLKKLYRNTYSPSMVNDADLSNCHNVNDVHERENISDEVENIKPNNNPENFLSTVLQSECKVTSDKLTKPSDNSQSDANVTSNALTKSLDNTESSLLVDLGYGVKIHQSILEKKIRKKNDRHLLLDLLNALYAKADFASCSRSGKKGKSVETAKPELDVNKQKAIMDYAVKILPEKRKEEIEVLLKKLIENKCKNAAKQNKLKEVPPL